MSDPAHRPGGAVDLEGELILDITQLTLDIIGFFEPTPFADSANAGISLARGDWLGATISLASLIPYLGDLAKIGKLPKVVATVRKAVALAARDGRFSVAVAPHLLKLRAAFSRVTIDALPEALRGEVKQLKIELETFADRYAPKPATFAQGGLAFRLLDELEIDYFLKALGKSGAPKPIRDKVALAGGFLMHHFKRPSSVIDYFKGIDLSREVRVVTLAPGQIMTQRFSGALGSWFCKSGVPMRQVGISEAGRQYRLYRVSRPIHVLETRAAATVDTWTWGRTANTFAPQVKLPLAPASVTQGQPPRSLRDKMKAGEYVSGGGTQYVVPEAASSMIGI